MDKNQKNLEQYAVLLPKNPTKSEVFASNELITFFKKATGVTLQVLKERSEEFFAYNGNFFSIGNTDLFKESGEFITAEKMNGDGVRVFTKNGNAILNAFTESGKIYAVYEFLKSQFSFTVYAPDEIHLDKTNNFELKQVDVTSIPDFKGRDVHNHSVFYDAEYAVRLRTNGVRTSFLEEHGEGCAWSKRLWVHSTFTILPPDKYSEEHPEWYTENKLQLCLATALEDTEDGRLMYNVFLENFKKFIQEEPNAQYFMIGQEDVGYTCQREKSLSMNAKYGGEKQASSGTLMVFINKIARDIKKWLLQTAPKRADVVKIVIFAYQKTMQPPVSWDAEKCKYVCVPEVIPEENVLVRFAPLGNVYSKDFLDEEYNKETFECLKGWSDIGAKWCAWLYDVGFGSYEYPLFNWHVFPRNYKIFKKYGFEDILMQGPCDSSSTPFLIMRNYVHSNLLWNVNADVDELIRDFMAHYYKCADKYMYQYYEYVNAYYKVTEVTKDFLARAGIWESADVSIPKYYSKEFLLECLKIFEKAKSDIALIEDDAERKTLLERVRREELAPRYMMLDLYRRDCDKKECDLLIKSFVADATELGLTLYREGKTTTIENRAQKWAEDLKFGTPVEYL